MWRCCFLPQSMRWTLELRGYRKKPPGHVRLSMLAGLTGAKAWLSCRLTRHQPKSLSSLDLVHKKRREFSGFTFQAHIFRAFPSSFLLFHNPTNIFSFHARSLRASISPASSWHVLDAGISGRETSVSHATPVSRCVLL